MKRAKPPKKKQTVDQKLIQQASKKMTDRIFQEVTQKITDRLHPIYLKAVKDTFKASDAKMEEFVNTLERYLNYVGDGVVDIEDVIRLLEE